MTQNSKSRVIALTGGIAAGKSAVARILCGMGAHIIDADDISRRLTSKGGRALPDIRAAFGDGVFSGADLDRAALARLVFASPDALNSLNNIVHPLVYTEMAALRARAQEQGSRLIVLDIPLLFETGYDPEADEIWLVDAPEETRIMRLGQRGMSREQALARMAAQMPSDRKRASADVVIENDGDMASLARVVCAHAARLLT